ncbi:MAG: hypothetical protein AAGA75_16265 [Cyanobacteria bacterium P01_E01_bin.6]
MVYATGDGVDVDLDDADELFADAEYAVLGSVIYVTERGFDESYRTRKISSRLTTRA